MTHHPVKSAEGQWTCARCGKVLPTTNDEEKARESLREECKGLSRWPTAREIIERTIWEEEGTRLLKTWDEEA